MKFEEFKDRVYKEISAKLNDTQSLNLTEVLKNNGLKLTGLTITEKGINISPTIYIDGYFEKLVSNDMNLEEIIDCIWNTYEKNKVDESIDFTDFLHFEAICEKIIFKLVNHELNQELLEDVPHVPFNGLEMIFQVLISKDEHTNATVTIHYAHLKIWDKDLEDLYFYAMKNTPVLKPMDLRTFNAYDVGITILTNTDYSDGASVVAYPGVLKKIADEIGSSLYLIPSSVHEWIVMLDSAVVDTENMRSIIREVNMTEVSEDEILSYDLYFYDKETQKLSIC